MRKRQPSIHQALTAISPWQTALGSNEDIRKPRIRYRKAIEANGQSGLAHFGLGTSLSRMDRLDESIEAFKQAARINKRMEVAYDWWKEDLRTLMQRNSSNVCGKFAEMFPDFVVSGETTGFDGYADKFSDLQAGCGA